MSERQFDPSVKPGRIFSQEELLDFSKGFMELALEAIEAGDLKKARHWCQREAETHDELHDILVKIVAGLLSYIYDRMGEEAAVNALHEMMGRVETPESIALRKQQGLEAQVRSAVDKSRQHSASPGLIVEEDEEKFILTVKCGSGGKLIKNGAYDGPNGLRRLKKAGPHTWGETDVPIYCSHCSWHHEIEPISMGGQGSQQFIHASPFPKKPGDPCIHLIYKNPEDIPEKYYKRLGFEKIVE